MKRYLPPMAEEDFLLILAIIILIGILALECYTI